jgi:hypothetical protein
MSSQCTEMVRLISNRMKLLLKEKVLELGRLAFRGEDIFLTETLFFKLESDAFIEILKINQGDLDIHLINSDEKPILPSWIENEEENVDDVFIKKIENKELSMPFKVESITEFWAGREGEEFLVGATLHDQNKEVLLSLCTDTDEIEIVSYSGLRDRITDVPSSLGNVQTHWYE